MISKKVGVLLLSASTLTATMVSCKEEKKDIKQTIATFKKEGELTLLKKQTDSIIKQLDIEIADSDYERQTGMMNRNSMLDNRGMLFVFPDMRPRSFYMKNTKITLDIIYLDDKYTIVSFQENAKPLDESSLPSQAAAKYVLEVNGGLARQWQLEVGDYMQFTRTKE